MTAFELIKIIGKTKTSKSRSRDHKLAFVAEEQGTTEHTEYTEVRDNGGRIDFRVFGVFCG
jgi:hypothetical protein